MHLLKIKTEVYIPQLKSFPHYRLLSVKRDLVKSFGEVLKELRKANGLSQQALGDYSETDRAFISRIERGISVPSIITIFKLAEVLKIKPKEFIEKVDHRFKK